MIHRLFKTYEFDFSHISENTKASELETAKKSIWLSVGTCNEKMAPF